MTLLDDPGKVIVALGAFASAWGIIHAIASSVIRLVEIRTGQGRPEVSAATEARLERIEHAMDAIAVEVERISESQRFLTKLLAEGERTDESDRPARLPS